jgi:FkbM family methyltransferase
MTVVDVGANIGYFTLLASTLVGPAGRVVAIEPNSENCRLLLMSVELNQAANVELLPVALDNRRGWSHFTTHIGANGGLIDGSAKNLASGYGVIVPTFRLDELLDGPVHLIKLDLEGGEGRAVEGATRLISEFRPVVTTELSFEMLSRVSGQTAEAYLSRFLSLGYSIFLVHRRSRRLEPIEDLSRFLKGWGSWTRIEDLLLVPRGPFSRELPDLFPPIS